MNLFTRIRQELLALGFSEVDEESYSEDGVDNFEATKDGEVHCFSTSFQDWNLEGLNTLHADEHTLTFNPSDEPGKGVWE